MPPRKATARVQSMRHRQQRDARHRRRNFRQAFGTDQPDPHQCEPSEPERQWTPIAVHSISAPERDRPDQHRQREADLMPGRVSERGTRRCKRCRQQHSRDTMNQAQTGKTDRKPIESIIGPLAWGFGKLHRHRRGYAIGSIMIQYLI